MKLHLSPVVSAMIMAFCSGIVIAPVHANVQLDFVPVTYANNAPDPTVEPYTRGAVSYEFGISKFEVTNAQYAEFLNAKASTIFGSDTLGLWADGMRGSAVGGILRSGSGTVVDPFTYGVKPFMGNKPVVFVTYFDALRFSNWLTNGQGSGDTETGSYLLTGGTATPSNWLNTPRQAAGRYFVPSLNEWYKAAYFQPSSAGGDVDNYWAYPTGSNTLPTQALPTTTGDVANPGSNVAIFDGGFVWGGSGGRGSVGTVGSAGGHSFFGAYDMGGNASEWTDTRWFGSPEPAYEVGGSYDFPQYQELVASQGYITLVTVEQEDIGFRIVDSQAVPEPTVAILMLGGAAWLTSTRRARNRT
jgi:formylglycine-generating enzyme